MIPLETAAAITAVMWASREYLGPKMKIIPVPANALIIEETANWNLKTVVEGSSSNKWLSYLPLKNTLSSADQTALDANQNDLFSFLHLASAEGHPLVYVSGPLAELELGPVSRNIAGARRAGERIVDAALTSETIAS